MRLLSLGYSPCPNDTFLFYPLIRRLVDTGELRFRERLEDVATLNRLAMEGALDVCKVSCHAFAHIRERYVLLRAGGAFGRGSGPLIVARRPIAPGELGRCRIAVPGRHTTAMLLLKLMEPEAGEIVFLPFSEIVEAVALGEVDAGVVIHESRFTFESRGLHQIVDLGVWWEARTGLPLPLGAVAARRDLGASTLAAINDILRSSVLYASTHPSESSRYVRSHSQEANEDVCASHIGLYVNDFSLDPGPEGEKALTLLFSMGEQGGLLPRSAAGIYLPPQSPTIPDNI